MSVLTKTRRTESKDLIQITMIYGDTKETVYVNKSDRKKISSFLKKFSKPVDDSIEWGKLASDRLKKYKKAGLVLRGMRVREGMTQKELSKKTKISQDNISRIENGKRTVGEKVAKRLAKALNFDYRLLIQN